MQGLWGTMGVHSCTKGRAGAEAISQRGSGTPQSSPATGTGKPRDFRSYRGRNLAMGIARWEKPSFLTHSDDGAGEVGTVPGREGSEGTYGGACVSLASLARFQGHNNSERAISGG